MFQKQIKNNTINDLENENKKLKRELKRRQPIDSLFQFIGLNFYRRIQLVHLKTDVERILKLYCKYISWSKNENAKGNDIRIGRNE